MSIFLISNLDSVKSLLLLFHFVFEIYCIYGNCQGIMKIVALLPIPKMDFIENLCFELK